MTTTIYGPVAPWLADRRRLTRLPLAAIRLTPLGAVRRLPAAVLEARLAAMGLGVPRLEGLAVAGGRR